MKSTFLHLRTQEDWNRYFNDLLYSIDFKMKNPIGTLEGELNLTFNHFVKLNLNPDLFWNGLLDVFSRILPKEEYIDNIYGVICFLEGSLPHKYETLVKEIITRQRFAKLYIPGEDEFDLNDLLLNNLVSGVLLSDDFLENTINNGIADQKPYYFYLLAKYYLNIGYIPKAIAIIENFFEAIETEYNVRCLTNSLYAFDENIPTKISWVKIITQFADRKQLYKSKTMRWQMHIFKMLVKSREEDIRQKEIMTESETSLILLLAYINKNQPLYNRFSYDIAKLEDKYPQVKQLSTKILQKKSPVVKQLNTQLDLDKMKEQVLLTSFSKN